MNNETTIRTRILLSFLLLVGITSSFFFLSSYHNITESMNSQAIKHGSDMARSFSLLTEPYILDSDYVSVNEVMEQLIQGPDVEEITITSVEGRIWASTRVSVENYSIENTFLARVIADSKPEYRQIKIEGHDSIEFVTPITTLGDVSYLIFMRFSLSDVEKEVSNQIDAAILYTLLGLILSALIAFLLSRILIRPFRNLLRGTNEIMQGNYSYRIAVESGDEAGKLSQSFNEMTSHLEQELSSRKHAERGLKQANSELLKAAKAKDNFLASMSHELRTPLTAILGLSEVLQEQVFGQLNPKQLEYLSTIQESGSHLLDLINDILDLAKIEAGKFEMREGELDFNGLAESSIRLVNGEATRQGVRVSSVVSPDLPRMLGDQRHLKQVLVNLLGNAVKFTPKGKEIGLTISQNPALNRVEMLVWDKGIGVSEEDQLKIFEPFEQVDSELSRKYSGTGLGLALVANIVRLHGGEVSVLSDLGKGSQFIVSLPIRTLDANSTHLTPGLNNESRGEIDIELSK